MKPWKSSSLPIIQKRKSFRKRISFKRGKHGTICSSVYRKALELIDHKYDPAKFNIYPFHFSDGDNLTSDNVRCVKLVEELMKVSNMFGYGEVNQYNRHSTLMTAYKNIDNEKFRYYILKQKADVFHAMKSFLKMRKVRSMLKIGRVESNFFQFNIVEGKKACGSHRTPLSEYSFYFVLRKYTKAIAQH